VKIGVKTDGTSVRKGKGWRVGCGTFVIVTDSSKLQCTACIRKQWDESTVQNGSSSLSVSHRINKEY
jgi:hypothetical protein